MTDLRSCQMTYEATEWFKTDLRRSATKRGSSCELGHLWVKLTSSMTVKSDRGACRFQWRVSPSYCEYSGVTYDLLVSNIGGTYHLADQLPSNHEFGHFLVVNQSSGVRCKPSIHQCWLIFYEVLQPLPEGNFTGNAADIKQSIKISLSVVWIFAKWNAFWMQSIKMWPFLEHNCITQHL